MLCFEKNHVFFLQHNCEGRNLLSTLFIFSYQFFFLIFSDMPIVSFTNFVLYVNFL